MTGVTSDLITATLALALLAIASSPRVVSASGSQTHSVPVAPTQESGVDTSIRPGDDFYAYANGDWLKETTIPAGLGRWSARDEIDANTKRQVATLIEEAATQPLGSYQRKVADFYTAYLADNVIEAKGITSIKPLLTRIDGVHDKVALTRLLGSDLRADVDPLNYGIYASSNLFGLSVERGIHGETHHFAYLLQGGLGLPDRDYYLATSPKMQAERIRYQENIGRVLKLAGFDRAAQRARKVMALETAIARSHGSRLTIDAGDAVGNSRRAADWHYGNALIKLDQPTDITEWVTLPQTVGAIYVPLQNAYNFSAALLQAPKFDPTASDAASYGAIGAIAGHEITHFVDSLGANYDADGGMHLWWTNADKAKFEASSVALVTQFSSYRPFPDLSINGKLTLTENIADLGGLAVAFDAYRRTLGRKANDQDYVRILDRQFFIGFARAWRVKTGIDALRTQVTTNDHAPENFRVSTVRNMDAWYDAFDVLPGQRLYLEPKARVRIW